MEEFSKHIQKIAQSAYENVVHENDHNQLLFQHAVLCQVYLPYKNLGPEVTSWVRQQGKAHFAIQTTKVFNPDTGQLDASLGLPYGPKARLVLTHINTMALQQQTPHIEVTNTLTSFVKSCGLMASGQQIEMIKNQLARLASSMISIAFNYEENKSLQVDSKIIKGFDIWFPKNLNQRVMWDSNITLSDDYFNSLMNHAVPLDARHVSALANNSMALDIYTWLAQRLHRVGPQKEFVPWLRLKEQFGEGFNRMPDFKRAFRNTLKLVLIQYQAASIAEEGNRGFFLTNSPPPVPPKTYLIPSAKALRQG